MMGPSLAPLSDGTYRVDLTLAGLKPASIKHLELKSSGVMHANVAMRFDPSEQVMVGALAVEPMSNSSISTTFTQSFIDKLPR
jgi:hypothetical protein